jgi:hypothetical protein
MTRTISLATGVLAILSLLIITRAGEPMTENETHLKEAQADAQGFQDKREPDLLRRAYVALENVILAKEGDPGARAQLRTSSLNVWLRLLELLDRFLDPEFNPDDVPERLVQPPPTSGGVVHRPGADPALIDDPVARAQYEEAIAANKAKTTHYVLQTKLRRLDERIVPRAEAFIRSSYTSDPRDQKELKTAIDGIITNPQRRAGLLRLLP